ncbi:M20 family metallopeptidase [Heyndrickxia faecalis]|uniref:M20 family metallopeptidase n=1 Tax=Heyndrickxia faecalis TaxID=2824910 RepID=UPI001B3A44F5|nr:M20 family metallopeptidase [Heyndrickxia faecalis]MBQ4909937.1 amidohydrolase [Heyndrickxia faecalis]
MALSLEAEKIDALVEQVREDVIHWRRHLHQNPELSFQEVETSQFIYDTLASFGGLALSRPTKTSVVARLKGAKPGRVLAIRADMDALPIQEENSFDFVSQHDGVMHACGHDGHTAMLLGAAKILAGLKDQIAGEIRFLFQHAEEQLPGGAEEMVQAGVMDGVDQVIGAHLWSPLEAGKIELVSGPMMAAPDAFYITINGKGGHGAQPHLAIDSIAIGAQVVTNLQHIVSRNIDPLDPVVLSVTQFIAGTAHNVIPGSVFISGTVRTFKPALQEEVIRLMERVVKGVTEAHGAAYDFQYVKGYRPVINDPEVTAKLREVLVEAFGEDAIQDGVPTMGGEDFSGFQQKAPGTFFFIGAGNADKGIVYPHHHARFTVDEDVLPYGVKAFVAASLTLTA